MWSPGQVTSSLALWLHLRRHSLLTQDAAPPVTPPVGDGPLLLVHVSEQESEPRPIGTLLTALIKRRPGLRLVFTGAPPSDDDLPSGVAATCLDLPHDPAGVGDLLARLGPSGLLLLGDGLPPALITGMAERRLPIILAEARLSGIGRRGTWRGAVNRGLLQRVTRILVPDISAGDAARHLGADPERIAMIGPITETRPPLHANEAERSALAQILRGRHIWLAAAPTRPEIAPILNAHQAALQHNHRALLIIAALPEDQVADIKAEAEALGLAAVLRSEDDDPQADDHVLIADDPYEMGLWYRLAPVCFMGGTLLDGPALPPRHPFEPAALGSAVIHGPLPGPHAAEWLQLDGASAARLVTNAEALSRAVSDLTAPDQAAMLAGNAWSVCTGGAAVIRKIADTVIDTLEKER